MTPNPRPLLWLFLAAAVARLAWVAAGVAVPPQDTPDYDEIARNLLAGDGFVARQNWFGHELRSWRAPLFPLFLAAVYRVAGTSHAAVQIAQCLLGAATVVLVYLLAHRLRPALAPVAGVAAAVYAPLVASAAEVMTEALFTALLVAAVWAALEARARGGWRWSAAAGVLTGLAGLTRPVGLLAAPALVAVAAWEERAAGGPWRRRWLPFAIALCAGVAAALSPWTLRNAAVHGAFIPVSTHGGFIIARSNADAPDWRRPGGWGIDRQTFERVPGEVERDRQWLREGLAWIAGHPGIWLRLAGERFLRLWYVFRPEYNASLAFLLPLFAAGFVRCGAEPGFRYLSAVILLSVAVFCLLLYGSTRFRLPLEPFFLVYGAAAAVDGWARWGRAFGAVLALWGAANGAVWWQEEAARSAVVASLEAAGLK